jgi:hypothetical protein
MLDFGGLNWLAIFVATATGFVLGGLWYGPLFGEAWLRAVGKRKEDVKPSATPFVTSFFTALATAIVLAALISNLGIVTARDGAILGSFVGFGFIATAMASDSAFCGWGRSLLLIQAGYRVTYSVIMGVILAVWQ